MVETASQTFDVLLYHDITIITDNERYEYKSSISSPNEVPRAPETLRKIGALVIASEAQEQLIELREITFGRVKGLPAYNPDRPVVVSRMTIAAAVRAGRPVDDLLYPYEPIRDPITNDFLGVKGLAYAEPVARKRRSMDIEKEWPEGIIRLSASEIQSTCPYDTKLYASETPNNVPKDTLPKLLVPKACSSMAADIMYDEQFDETRSDRFGVPIYRTQATGLRNDWSQTPEAGWSVCHIDTPVVAENPSPQHVIVHDLVRDTKGYMLGGRQFARIAQHHFAEPLV
jgi:hypothetical protein